MALMSKLAYEQISKWRFRKKRAFSKSNIVKSSLICVNLRAFNSCINVFKGVVERKAFAAKKMYGATLIESLTALAILTAVIGASFTLYEKVMSNQRIALKTKAAIVQSEFENALSHDQFDTEITNEDLTVNIESEPYKNQADLKHVTLIINDKKGKQILKKDYLKYVPNR